MKIELNDKEIMLIIAILQYTDPTGFYANSLVLKIKESLTEEIANLKEEEKPEVKCGDCKTC